MLCSGTSLEMPGQVAGFVMIRTETSYTPSRCFFNMEKTLAGQDDPISRLNQRDRQVMNPVKGVMGIDDAWCGGVEQGCESAHVNSFSMVYRRIAKYFK